MEENTIASPIRRQILYIIIVGFFAVLVFKLFSMQILERTTYEEKSEDNSIKKIMQTAPRGVFFDRNRKVLVSNKPSFTLEITPSDYDRKLDHVIEAVIGVDSGYISRIFRATRTYSKYIPRKIMRDVDLKFISWYEENSSRLPGVRYVIDLKRDYSFGVNGSHMFGYTKEISSDQLQKYKDEYEMGDIIGYNGLEKNYEDYLHGEKGINYIVVDSRQQTIGRYKNGTVDKPPVKGYDLVLTIDEAAQRIAEQEMKGRRGAVVAIEPSTGEILAFVSSPEYNLEDFASVTSSDVWRSLNDDPEKPLFNRATMSVFSPGSTYKMLAATAALEEGVIDQSFTVTCHGGFQFGNRFFKCLHVHGTVNVVSAIEKSCNTFFYQLILKMGLDKWSEYSRKFGFGSKTGIDIGEEVAGLVPDANYYDRHFGKGQWTNGLLVSLGIGQGELGVTPIQMAKYAALFANFGKTGTPHLVKGYLRGDNDEFVPVDYKKIDIGISKATFDIVREGMYRVVNGAGTATNIRLPDIAIAGKTGTAQNPHGKEHSVFVGFAPFDNPKIAIAVLVENAGFGSTAAAPIARDVIKAYLQKPAEEPKQEQPKDYISALRKNGAAGEN